MVYDGIIKSQGIYTDADELETRDENCSQV